jgi:hypothetical protein
MYLVLVLFTDITRHKAATIFIPCPSLSFYLSPLPYTASFQIWELTCSFLAHLSETIQRNESQLRPTRHALKVYSHGNFNLAK